MRDLQELLIRDWLAPADLKTRVVDHYTTAAGLLGILSSGSLRGTNAAFLDDSSEIAYDLAARAVEREQVLIDRTLSWIRDDTSPRDVYVMSFPARRDVLSQWRAYAGTAARFSIGFQMSQFSERDRSCFPQRSEYDGERQRASVR